MAQYPIPQFTEAEGKIISFLTFKQFFWLVGGGAACLLFYYTLPFWLFMALSILVGLLVAIVAFVKINNTSVIVILFNFITFLIGSKNYVWKKRESPYPFKVKKTPVIGPAKPFSSYDESQVDKLKEIKKIVELRKKK